MVPDSFEDAYIQVKELAERFAANEAAYLAPKYQEAEARNDFINPFFVALGWDVYHHEHPNPYEREVKIEKSVMVGDRGKRADYAFYTTPNYHQARFLAEAKKPARQLENQYDCFQAIRYGWNSNTPIAVLTDFEQLIVLDSRYKPTVERSLNGILEKFHYTEFSDEETFRKLYYLFSRESVGNNSLEKFVEGLRKPKGKKAAKAVPSVQIQPVGDTFLTELDAHRENLARAFKRSNNELDGEELAEITQRTLDRLVFIRFLEDKLVEPSDIIDRLGKKTGSSWRDFANEIPRLNQVYNGIIFKPHAILDSPNFAPDSKTFDEVLGWLSHKNSAYDFNSIPIHILGSIYERFLGKTITVSDKRARVEEKPEVRKAGGVYYTPEYIVRYIVENTIGKLLLGVPPSGGPSASGKPAKAGTPNPATPEEISKMRFADIACGSGSFLLGIFDYLIKYHVDWYTFGIPTSVGSLPASGPAKAGTPNSKRRIDAIKRGLCREASDGSLQLTLEHKRDILLNNIYGVDLDAQAVEVAQLSLYLKLLEEETAATVQPKLAGLREQLLPNLNKNIVHGNSLIDYDIMDGQLFDSRDLKKLNPMSFQSTFPTIFANGGFEAIIGNPPYVDIKGLPDEQVRYLFSKYPSANNRINLFAIFIERSLSLLNISNFKLSMIVPTALLTQDSYKVLRKKILEKFQVRNIARLPNESFGRAAGDVKVDTAIVVINPGNPSDVEIIAYSGYDRIMAIDQATAKFSGNVSQSDWMRNDDFIWSITLSDSTDALLRKIEADKLPLEKCAEFCLGLTPYDKYKGHTPSQIENKVFHADHQKDKTFKKLLAGNDVRRYSIQWNGETWISYGPWLGAAREQKFFTQKHVLVKQIIDWTTKRIWASVTDEELYNTQNAFNLLPRANFTNEYLLAVINSRLLTYYHQKKFLDEFKMRFQKILIKDAKRFPIHPINPADADEKAIHDRIVDLVKKMLDGTKKLAHVRTDSDRAFYERFCENIDRQIDELVYGLYGITPDERKIIEG